MRGPLTVLVADDSAFMRKVISEVLSAEDGICVVGQARDGFDAVEKAERLRPDVITMDVEMPGLDGIAALARIMQARPTPTIMLSSATKAGADITLACLEIGAVDFVAKPSGAISLDIASVAAELVVKVKAAGRFGRRSLTGSMAETRCALPPDSARARSAERPKVVVIGSSTGGPAALQAIVPALPAHFAVPVVVVQHMPALFTTSLAARLDAHGPLRVREAEDADRLSPGHVLVAPGGKHLVFDAAGAVCLTDEPPVHGVRPAIDTTIASLAACFGGGVIAVLLTGMGRDGALGLKRVSDAGGATIAQDEASCVVYGMPRAACELGAAQHVLPLGEIAGAIAEIVARRSLRRAA